MRLLLKPIGVALWLGLILAGILYLGGSDFLLNLERDLLDDRFRSQPKEKRKFPSSIVLVEINNDSIHTKQRIPWDQDKIATLLANLRKAEPKTIVVDLPLLRGLDPIHHKRLEALLKAYNTLHPVVATPTAKDPKKKKKRRRRLSRRQKEELARKKVLQKKIDAVRKELTTLLAKPSHSRLLDEIKKTKNLVLPYRYYRLKKEILGIDGRFYNKQTKAAKKAYPTKGKKNKKAKKKALDAPKLLELKAPQLVGGAPEQTPALNVFFLRPNPELIGFAKYHGFTNLQERQGQVLRMARLVIRKDKAVHPSLALAAYMAFKSKNPTLMIGNNGYVAMDVQEEQTRALNKNGLYRLDYYGPKTKIPQAQRVLAGDVIAGKNFTKSDFEGKLVFVGISSTPSARTYRTPYAKPFSSLEIHATIAANLLRGETILRGQKQQMIELGLLVFLALLLGGLSMKLRHFGGFIALLILIGALQFANNFILFPGGEWFQFAYIQLSLIVVYLGISMIRRLTEDVRRQETRSRFASRMGQEDYKRVLRRPNDLPLEGNWRPVTVLSGECLPLGQELSEQNNPQQVIKMLSHLVNPMGEAICRNRGTVGQLDAHSFQGFFNAPFDLATHAEHACTAALQMRSESEPFLHQWDLEGLPTPQFSVGLDLGNVVAGNFGGKDRFLYSITGSPVEFSLQMKQLNQHYQSNILLSEAMVQEVQAGGRFVIRELDSIRFQEDQEPITIYELLGNGPATSPLHEAVEWYQHGLQFYRARNFQEAVRYFQEIVRVRPDDGPAQTMLKRSQRYINYPPSFQWDGTWKLK